MTEQREQKKRNVTIAVDLSAEANKAVRWTLYNLVKPECDHVCIVSAGGHDTVGSQMASKFQGQKAHEELSPQAVPGESENVQQIRNTLHESEKIIKEYNETNESKVNYTLHPIKGPSAREDLVSFAKEHAVDVIVLGLHGKGTGARLLTGSTSEYVIQHAPCPVVIVRETKV